MEFYVRLQQGITGGFAPPTPSEIHIITASSQFPESISITSSIRPHGTPDLQDATPTSIPITHVTHLVEELHAILKIIPIESPPGSEDIYGMDTSIAWGSNDLEWVNGGPSGCSGGVSTVQPTEADKAKFRRAVEIVKELVAATPP